MYPFVHECWEQYWWNITCLKYIHKFIFKFFFANESNIHIYNFKKKKKGKKKSETLFILTTYHIYWYGATEINASTNFVLDIIRYNHTSIIRTKLSGKMLSSYHRVLWWKCLLTPPICNNKNGYCWLDSSRSGIFQIYHRPSPRDTTWNSIIYHRVSTFIRLNFNSWHFFASLRNVNCIR